MKKIFLLFSFIPAVIATAQSSISTMTEGFEQGLGQWQSPDKGAGITPQASHTGSYCVLLHAGGSIERKVAIKPGHQYLLSAWLKTASGSDEIQLRTHGLAAGDISASSALADWVNIQRNFTTSKNQSSVTVEIFHPDNAASNDAWADDITLTDLGEDKSTHVTGIHPLPQRQPATEYGITQQPDNKVDWLIEARFGMFIHWGLYAGPGKGEWYMENSGTPIEEYRKLAYPQSGNQYFAADKFDADAWAALAKSAGMRYMCLTTMHHDGYGLFASKYMNAFNSKQTHNRDFVEEYTDACRKAGLKVGLYKTLINWRYPGYYDVNGTGVKPNKWGYVTDSTHRENARLMKEELYCQVKELMTNYGKIDMIFWDGGWLGQQGQDADAAYFWEPGKYLDPANKWPVNPYFQEKDALTRRPLGLMGIVRKFQPGVIVNERSGWMGDYKSEEGGSLITGPVRSKDAWQKCMTVGGAWGYSPAEEDSTRIISPARLKRMLADVVIRNMALLLNVGPDRHGAVPAPVVNLLQETGRWLASRQEAIYGTHGGPWNPEDGQYGFAWRDSTLYVFLLDDFTGKALTLPAVNPGQHAIDAYEVGAGNKVLFTQNRKRKITITIPVTNDNIRIVAVKLNKPVMEE